MKNRVVKIILSVYFGLFILLLLVFGYHWTFYEEAPEQPIAFSHKKHVGELELECLTCHVYVDDAWIGIVGEPDPMEEDMLDFAFDVRPTSRLSCQIKVRDDLDGLLVRIPERQA